MRTVVVLLVATALVLAGPVAWAFNCPVVIKQAEDLIKKAEAGKVTPETRQLIDESKKLVVEAKAHHENAKTKRDHGDAVRKAKTAAAFAEEALAAEITQAGRRALVVPCDVTRDGDLERAAALTRTAFGKLDIVVANAGFGVVGALETLSLDDYRRQFETNVFGVLRPVYATLEDLKKTRGRLV